MGTSSAGGNTEMLTASIQAHSLQAHSLVRTIVK